MRKLVLILGLCLAVSPVAQAKNLEEHCAKVGDKDRLKPLPPRLVDKARKIFGLSDDAPAAMIRAGTVTRCMDGKAWLCNSGANLVCDKANTSRENAGATAFCQQNPNAGTVPMSATGHDTIYSWRCEGGVAKTEGAPQPVDARGFLTNNWKPLGD